MKHIRGNLPLIAVLSFAIIGLVFFQILKANASSGIQDKPESQQIMKALEKGYQAFAYATQTDDPSKLSEIFVDTSDYKLSAEVKKDVEKVFGSVVAEKAGYLTAMQAKTIAYGKINADMKAALEKAKSENRKMTNEEYRAIINKNNGLIPPSKSPSGKYDSSKEIPLTFERIEINGDHATVYYDDGAASQKATMVKIDGKWFIAGIESIVVHF